MNMGTFYVRTLTEGVKACYNLLLLLISQYQDSHKIAGRIIKCNGDEMTNYNLKKYRTYQKKKKTQQTVRFKNESSRRTYFDRLFARIFLSSILLLLLLIGANYLNFDARSKLNDHGNLAKVSSYFLGLFNPELVETVASTSIYDTINYVDGVNKISNQESNFQGVQVFSSGTVVKISKVDERYSVTIKGIDGYEYTYRNLESIDCLMYQYVASEKIIGSTSQNCQFELVISYDKSVYSIYEVVVPVSN